MEVEINQACANGIEAKSANQGKQYGQKSAQKRPPPPPPGVRQNYELTPIVPVNDRLFEYYRQQGIVPEEEWSNFEEALKTELPASFRVQLSLGESQNLANHIESKFIPEITNIAREEGPSSGIDPPEKISFVPFAYQTKMSRQAIRSHTILKDFHEFLINETQLGCISRQEVCSMIPPLLLRIESHHVILDACAAPGSKTMQMLELMHKDTANPEGMLVANDVDYKRCYLLVHQTLKRIPTANCVVTSHDSTHLPAIIGSDQKPLLFDRILCDLICSGDGTFRKNPDLWRTWDPMKGVHLHKLQLHIARRCIELLKPDGLMCYSTCSMNPLEDEAVIAQILRLSKGTVELVDISGELLGLKRTPGISKWKVFNKELKAYVSAEEIPQAERRHLKPSMFPPSDEEAQQMHLERCFRILPHQQNTGGFFVALLRKTQPTPLEEVGKIMHPPIGKPAPAKRRRFQNKEDPFVFLADRGEEKEVQEELKTHFGVPADEFPYRNLLVRSNNAERKKEIYYVNDMLRQFLVHNRDRFKIVNAGLGILKKIVSDKVAPCPYRLKQDGLPLLIPWINKRNLHISPQLLITILKGGAKSVVIPMGDGKPTQYVSKLELGEHSQLFEDLEPGSVVLQVSEPFSKAICAWIGANSVSAFVSREERFHLLSILGQDITDFKRNTNTTRQVKAQRVKDNQVDEQDEEMQMKNADE